MKKILIISLFAVAIVAVIIALLLVFPKKGEKLEGTTINMSGIASGIIDARCADESYKSDLSDVIIEGEVLSLTVKKLDVADLQSSGYKKPEIVDSVESFLVTSIKINNIVKGSIEDQSLGINIVVGKSGGMIAEDHPDFTKGEKIKMYLKNYDYGLYPVCGNLGVVKLVNKSTEPDDAGGITVPLQNEENPGVVVE